ncbi:MAG: hypothetical protein Q7K28_01295 [Candidatus Wildermuthbacteria bacterium]|nr:hypothetical protein [Candidatus Wildermuthbacteria bacterium]
MGYDKRLKKEASHDNVAVILGLCPTGLAVVRALGRHNIEVYGVDKDRWSVGFFSKYCRRLGYFDAEKSAKELLEKLIIFSKSLPKKPVLFATSDDYLAFLAKYNDILQNHYLFALFVEKMLDIFLNKKTFYQLCIKQGVPIPPTYFPKGESEVTSIAERIKYPCIIKPIYTHLWARRFGIMKVIKVFNRDEMIRQYRSLGSQVDNIMIQEIVEGADEDIYIFAGYFDRKFESRTLFTGRKLRQFPINFGTTTFAESVWLPEVARVSVEFLKSIRFSGLCDVEFKRDKNDNQLKLIEINPRPGRWYSLTGASGADIVYESYADLAGIEINKYHHVPFKENVKWILFSRDLPAAIGYMLKGELSLKSWLNSLSSKKEDAIYSQEDLLPSFGYFFEILHKIFKMKHIDV